MRAVFEEVAEHIVAWEENQGAVTWTIENADMGGKAAQKSNMRNWMVRRHVYQQIGETVEAGLHAKADLQIEWAREGGYIDENGTHHSAKDILRDLEENLGRGMKKTSGRWRQIHQFVEKHADWLEFEMKIDKAAILGVVRQDIPTNISEVSAWLNKLKKWAADPDDELVKPDTLRDECIWLLEAAKTAKTMSAFSRTVKARYTQAGADMPGQGASTIFYAMEELDEDHLRVLLSTDRMTWHNLIHPSLSTMLEREDDLLRTPVTLDMLLDMMNEQHRESAIHRALRAALYASYDTSVVFGILDRRRDEWLRVEDFQVTLLGDDMLSDDTVTGILTTLWKAGLLDRILDDDGSTAWKMEGDTLR
jgi:hypothetical protein